MNFRGFSTLFLSFLKSKKEKAMFVLGEISGTCFTIFLILFNRFPLSVMSYFPICINISSSLFFRRLPNFYITFLLVPTRKLVSKKLSFLLKTFLNISVSTESPAARIFLLWLCFFFISFVSINNDLLIYFFFRNVRVYFFLFGENML